MKVDVSYACNDSHGFNTGRTQNVELGSVDGCEVELSRDRPVVCHLERRGKHSVLRLGRRRYPCSDPQFHVGNLLWNSVMVDLETARELLANLIVSGWRVEGSSIDGPLTEALEANDPR